MKKLILGIVCLTSAAFAAEPPRPQVVPAPQPEAVAPAPVPAAEAVPVALDGVDADATCEEATATPAKATLETDLLKDANQAAGCKPCKGRTWCKCTYNGFPRSSCNPCCYTNDIGVTVCLD